MPGSQFEEFFHSGKVGAYIILLQLGRGDDWGSGVFLNYTLLEKRV